MWWKTFDGDYVNGDLATRVSGLSLSGGTYGIVAQPTNARLAGEWATGAEANDAIRQLVQGVDPSEA